MGFDWIPLPPTCKQYAMPTLEGRQVLRVLGTNNYSLFMSFPVAMDSISKTRAARRTQFVAVLLEWRANQILELQLTCCESGAPTVIAQIASTFFDKTLKCSYLSSPNLFSRVNSAQGRA